MCHNCLITFKMGQMNPTVELISLPNIEDEDSIMFTAVIKLPYTPTETQLTEVLDHIMHTAGSFGVEANGVLADMALIGPEYRVKQVVNMLTLLLGPGAIVLTKDPEVEDES